VRTRRFYKPPSLPPSILGRLTSRTRSIAGGPDAFNAGELQALNCAIEAEPIEALDRQVFELHYRHRVKGIKAFATALGIGRQHWYTLLRSFEQRVYAASLEIRESNERARQALRSYSD
jgi:ribosomal protein S18 acetylase RimI-like enzyme